MGFHLLRLGREAIASLRHPSDDVCSKNGPIAANPDKRAVRARVTDWASIENRSASHLVRSFDGENDDDACE
jgi:hypothetical protein